MAKRATARKPVTPTERQDNTEWLLNWRVALALPLLPVSWPAEAGEPHEGAVCGCCRCARWWLQPDPHGQSHDGWICASCHPPPRTELDHVRFWPAPAATPPQTMTKDGE